MSSGYSIEANLNPVVRVANLFPNQPLTVYGGITSVDIGVQEHEVLSSGDQLQGELGREVSYRSRRPEHQGQSGQSFLGMILNGLQLIVVVDVKELVLIGRSISVHYNKISSVVRQRVPEELQVAIREPQVVASKIGGHRSSVQGHQVGARTLFDGAFHADQGVDHFLRFTRQTLDGLTANATRQGINRNVSCRGLYVVCG